MVKQLTRNYQITSTISHVTYRTVSSKHWSSQAIVTRKGHKFRMACDAESMSQWAHRASASNRSMYSAKNPTGYFGRNPHELYSVSPLLTSLVDFLFLLFGQNASGNSSSSCMHGCTEKVSLWGWWWWGLFEIYFQAPKWTLDHLSAELHKISTWNPVGYTSRV